MYLCQSPPPPFFSQVLILKVVKVLCFDALLQVLILNAVSRGPTLCSARTRRPSEDGRYVTAAPRLCRLASRRADPIFSGYVLGCDVGESRLGEEIAVLRVAEVCGAEQRHHYAVD